ncbi:hypothetical protein [Prosthecobacter sp.]|uniref:hypothetical protein n=1 Tax=Prosthecobacter sp. TaxID=1965333 RepID=UPI002489B613|nr:hypothetical protein [Prosthecobacter sp.]MDI1311498.1 hypothetical protein [Prosthecobacter sp.]
MLDTNNVVGDGTDIYAALFDRGGLYQGSDSFGWTLIPDLTQDNPSSMSPRAFPPAQPPSCP